MDVVSASDRPEPHLIPGDINRNDTTRFVAPAGIVLVPIHVWALVVSDDDGRQTVILGVELNLGCVSSKGRYHQLQIWPASENEDDDSKGRQDVP